MGQTHLVKSQSDTLPDTATSIADQHGVSRATILRDGKRAEALDRLAEEKPDEAQAVRGADLTETSFTADPARQNLAKKPAGKLECVAIQAPRGNIQAQHPQALRKPLSFIVLRLHN